MEELVELMDHLSSVTDYIGGTFDINLPQIIIVGEPSSGKSSIIESIIGMDILPKGINIMTRCPVFIQLNHTEGIEYARFSHKPHQMFYDLGQIPIEITIRTKALLEKNKKFTNKIIHLTIFSPKVLNFNLIDLPGLPRLDEVKILTVHTEIEQIIMEFLTFDDTIILGVIEANEDIRQSEVFKIISRVDKSLEHTIGVITKVDLCESQKTVMNMIENRNIIPGKGWAPVKYRSLNDLNMRRDIYSALDNEVQYFQTNYPNLNDACGSTYLKKIIYAEMKDIIISSLPDIMRTLQNEVDKSEALVKQLKYYNDNIEKRDVILKFRICN
uniref:Dynamin-1 (Trinotate prediction) n=1 Tax=Henneguya salminicola TaxID=69463 RepID=A0A6G3MF96_HENSL